MGKAIKWTLAAAVLLIVGMVSYPFVTFKDHRISTGEAYGFVVGETAVQTYDRAIDQIRAEEIEAFELGQGSSAVLYDGNDPSRALSFNHWQLVVDRDWWNNTIYLSFKGGNLVEIWRFRVCCEVP
jgi:hypothetical protein